MGSRNVRTGLEITPADRVELLVSDSSSARAFFEGIPAARLLGRARLASDAFDARVAAAALESSGGGRPEDSHEGVRSRWDALMARLLGAGSPAHARVKRAIARHARAAINEGPLVAGDATVAALVLAVAWSADIDFSLAEIARGGGERPPQALFEACAAYDPRLSSRRLDPRIPFFEACVRLAAKAIVGPWPWRRLLEAAVLLSGPKLAQMPFRPTEGSLFPYRTDDLDASLGTRPRRMVQIDRTVLDALVAMDPRVLALSIARLERDRGKKPSYLDSLVADLTKLLSHPGPLVLAVPHRTPSVLDDVTEDEGRVSWIPSSWDAPDAASSLADAIERRLITWQRANAVVLDGGEPALDAIGAEMLHVTSHPVASAAFADMLARSGRPRDVIRLVTYFAVAPDPAVAARALAACVAPELPRVLWAWLEAMLPSDGEPVSLGEDPATSVAARLAACVSALSPYPILHHAVRPLLSRVSAAPAV